MQERCGTESGHGPNHGRTSTKADATAKIALTSSPTGIATWKPACSVVKSTPGRSERMEPEKAAGRHEGQRQQQHSRVAAPLGGLARRVAEDEGKPADDPEHDEVGAVVLEVGIELLAQEQGDEPDQRQREREAPDGEDRGRTPALLVAHPCVNVGQRAGRRIGDEDDSPSSSRTILGG